MCYRSDCKEACDSFKKMYCIMRITKEQKEFMKKELDRECCEDYKAYKEKADMAKQNRFKETGFESYLYDARKTMQDKRGVMRL